jgi:hypothetical protein
MNNSWKQHYYAMPNSFYRTTQQYDQALIKWYNEYPEFIEKYCYKLVEDLRPIVPLYFMNDDLPAAQFVKKHNLRFEATKIVQSEEDQRIHMAIVAWKGDEFHAFSYGMGSGYAFATQGGIDIFPHVKLPVIEDILECLISDYTLIEEYDQLGNFLHELGYTEVRYGVKNSDKDRIQEGIKVFEYLKKNGFPKFLGEEAWEELLDMEIEN